MTKRMAERFVGQMRRDHAFRSAVRLAPDEIELKGILRNHGFEFTMDELARAMASCMDRLDSMEINLR
ncbi:MAG: Nif11 family protein [Desulfobacterales bacterium]|nr:Nif11 family protein [Desulfobacterales bacterium]